MIKLKILGVLVSTIIFMLTTGCSDKNNNLNNVNLTTEVLEGQIENQNEEEINKKYTYTHDDFLKSYYSSNFKIDYERVQLGQMVKNEVVEFKLDEMLWMEEIHSSNGVSYYDSEEGNIFFVLKGTIKNISSNKIDTKYGSIGKIYFNGKYEYDIDTVVDIPGSSHFNSDLNPLNEGIFYMFAKVPYEIREIYERFDLKYAFDKMTGFCSDIEKDVKYLYRISTID